jgi:hypothetical protein
VRKPTCKPMRLGRLLVEVEIHRRHWQLDRRKAVEETLARPGLCLDWRDIALQMKWWLNREAFYSAFKDEDPRLFDRFVERLGPEMAQTIDTFNASSEMSDVVIREIRRWLIAFVCAFLDSVVMPGRSELAEAGV